MLKGTSIWTKDWSVFPGTNITQINPYIFLQKSETIAAV